MDSPVRQQQKRNDYQRHKLFRKMKRRQKAKKEQEKELAEKELRRKLRMPKYADGKEGYPNLKKIDSDVDYESFYEGELPAVTIKPDYNKKYDVKLVTHYPSLEWPIGHSEILTPGGNIISADFDDRSYDLLLNNCSDATRLALGQAFGSPQGWHLINTPNTVKSFAEQKLGGKTEKDYPDDVYQYGEGRIKNAMKGADITHIPTTMKQLQTLANFAHKLYRTGKYADGKPAYKIRTNDGELHNFSFDKEGNTVLDNGVVGSQLLDDVIVRPGVDVRKAIERRSERLAKQSEMIDITDPLSKENYGHGSGALESVYPEFDLIGLGALINTPKGLFNLSKNIPTATKNTTLGSLYKDVAKDAHVDLFKKLVKNRAHQRMANIGNYTKDPILDLGLEGNVEHIDEIPSWVMEMFENTVIPRLDSKFINEHGGIEGIKKILNEGGYNIADEAAWRQLYGNNFAGFNYDTTNGIAIRGQHNVNAALPHEVRHRLQRIYQLLKQRVNFRKNYLNDAYGSDFANLNTKLPETDPLHNYTRFMDEAETTNLDSRNYLFDYYTDQPLINQGEKLYGAPLTVQNKIIDSATDEQIIEAVRNANGYGRRYIEWIIDEAKRKNPNATIEQIYKLFAPQFRNAMKYVPAFGGVAVATTTGEYKHGKAPGIHIKPENRGKFTALKKRTGHSASWFKAHGTPAQKKMATFALNARKWKKK